VLFCDLVGSTSVGDRLDPEALRSVMAAYHAEMRDAVERHGGTVAKFIGDAVMAVFGLPELHEDDAFRAVRAADEMRGSLVGLGSELAESRDVRMACRIGVNTGVVVVGSGEEIITGDAVNIAARLEQAAHDNHVVLGEETERLVRGAVETSPIVVDAKGKAEPLSAHVLVSVAPDADPLGRRADTRMVGREDELALLLAMYRRTVRVGKCHQVTVLGPAGIGKSRLVREMTAGFPEALIVSGRCLPYGEGITYWPILEAFVEAFGDDPIAEIARLTAGDPDGERVTQSVAVALGLADGIGGEGIPWAVRRVLETLAERRPLVVVLDDMHSAESALHELIDHVASFARPVPLLLVCMARPELLDAHLGWAAGRHNIANLLLEPLAAEDGRALVNQLAAPQLPDDLLAQIAETADGNPLFAEQLVAMNAETAQGDVRMPPTIRALVAARIGSLPASLQTLLEHAAVEGKVFHLGALEAVLPEWGVEAIERDLTELARRDLVRATRSGFAGESAYAFHHLVIRDVAYEQMSKARRAEVHGALAEWLAHRGAVAAELRPYHLERVWQLRHELDPSGEPAISAAAAAAEALTATGRHAAERGDAAAASNLLGRAVATGAVGDPIGVAVELSYQLMDAGRFDDAATAIDQLAGMGGDLAMAYADIARCHLSGSTDPDRDLEELHARAMAATRLFSERGDDRGLSIAWLAIAEFHAVAGRNAASHRAQLEALAAARRAGDRSQEVRISAEIPIKVWFGPTPANDVVAQVDELLAAADTVDPVRAEALIVRGVARAAGGDIAAGREDVARGRSMRAELGQLVNWAVTAQLAARVEILAGDRVRAEVLLREGSSELARLGETGYLSTNEGQRALILIDLDRLPDATDATRVCRRTAARDDVASQALWRSGEALLRSHDGQHADAIALAREACTLQDTTDFLDDQAVVRVVLGRILAAAGDPGSARRAFAEAADLFDQKGIVQSAVETRERIAQLDQAPATFPPP
jgi:class 3 adenylate cyclase/tetratricopeptide (TPR) repeat protein